MENQEEKKTTCNCRQDAKTFLIALLTSIIVVAIYHFGCGLWKIYFGEPCGSDYPVCTQYMLVPVRAMPPCEFPRPCRGEKKFCHPGKFHGERRMRHPEMRHPEMKHPGMKHPEMRHPEMPEKAAPDKK